MKTIDQHIEDVMDEFNFHKVKEVMDFMDWKWAPGINPDGGVPEISTTRKLVREMMRDLYTRYYWRPNANVYSSTGGFTVNYFKITDSLGTSDRFKVSFDVASWDTGE